MPPPDGAHQINGLRFLQICRPLTGLGREGQERWETRAAACAPYPVSISKRIGHQQDYLSNRKLGRWRHPDGNYKKGSRSSAG